MEDKLYNVINVEESTERTKPTDTHPEGQKFVIVDVEERSTNPAFAGLKNVSIAGRPKRIVVFQDWGITFKNAVKFANEQIDEMYIVGRFVTRNVRPYYVIRDGKAVKYTRDNHPLKGMNVIATSVTFFLAPGRDEETEFRNQMINAGGALVPLPEIQAYISPLGLDVDALAKQYGVEKEALKGVVRNMETEADKMLGGNPNPVATGTNG